jgi:hypothetical protein
MYLDMNLDLLFIMLKRGLQMIEKRGRIILRIRSVMLTLSPNNELVMIDITGSSTEVVRENVINLENFTLTYGSCIKSCNNYTVRAVVLAPL